MSLRRPGFLLAIAAMALAGCAGSRDEGTRPGSTNAIAEGPNAGLSRAGAVWNLRGALNVAALKCGGDAADRYNAALKVHARAFRRAQARLMREYRREGGDWQDRFDDAQTRLYNHAAHPEGERRFCAAAQTVLAEIAAVPADDFAAFAARSLAALDRTLSK